MKRAARTNDDMHQSRAELRCAAVALVTAAITIRYFDRQTLPVAIAAIQRNLPISNQ